MKSLEVIYGTFTKIRVTPDKKVSALDILEAMGYSRPRDAWEEIKKGYPRLSEKSDNFKFSGQGQRKTPVLDKASLLELLMVTKSGKSEEFREWAVNVLLERLEEEKNPALIEDRAIAAWKRQGKSDKWISQRMQTKAGRIAFTNVLKDHGVTGMGYKNCTNAIYEPTLGGGAGVIRQRKQLSEHANTRESMSFLELQMIGLAETLAGQNIEKKNVKGNALCELECKRSAMIISDAVKKGLAA